MFRRLLFVLIFVSISLSACSQSSSPSNAVENYLAALVAKDDVLAVNLSCAAWESNAKAEGASFEGVEVTLEDASCAVVSEDSESAVVSCTGRFLFTYAGGEEQEIGLDRREYLVEFEGGEWRMCGYQ
jgi:hypothetical protein